MPQNEDYGPEVGCVVYFLYAMLALIIICFGVILFWPFMP